MDHTRFNPSASASQRAGTPALRLVFPAGDHRLDPFTPASRSTASPASARRIAVENRSAAGLSPSDARRILALRTAEMLDGGTLARLAPARRRSLLRTARILGVREFDANLVIAIAQDAARRGADNREIAADERLQLIATPLSAAPRLHTNALRTRPMSAALPAIGIGVCLGAAGCLLLVRWLLG